MNTKLTSAQKRAAKRAVLPGNVRRRPENIRAIHAVAGVVTVRTISDAEIRHLRAIMGAK